MLSGNGVKAPSTRSVALAVPRFTAVVGPLASTLIGGGAVTVGTVVSTTFTMKEPELVRLLLLVTLQLTVVAPRAKLDPLTGEQVGLKLPSVTSVAVAE